MSGAHIAGPEIVVDELPWRVLVRVVALNNGNTGHQVDEFVTLIHRDNCTILGIRGGDGQPIAWTRHRETTKDNVQVIEASDSHTYKLIPQFWAHPKDFPPG